VTGIELKAGWVAESMRGVLTAGAGDREFTGVSIDTRTIAPGDLFIAIRGDRFDGAAFAAAALHAGAAGVVVPRGWTAASRGDVGTRSVIEVDDTTVGLQSLAHAIRQASGTRVVAITGSAGKTTTKEITGELLAERYRVIRNRGNFNNHIGLPLSLIELRQRPEIAVVELGMNHAGEISTLVRVAEPDVRVWTNVGEAHLGFFPSMDAIADAKAEILEGGGSSALLVANADDERIMARAPRFAGRVMTFGIDRRADVMATAIVDRGVAGSTARITTPAGSAGITIPLIGRANLLNVLAAAAVAVHFEVPLSAIVDRVARLSPAAHRGEVMALPSGVTVIDDSYNANPTATKRALDVLAGATADRRIAVLGEMLELGDHAVSLHESVGRAAAESRVDVLFAVGGEAARAMADAATAAGMPRTAVRHFGTSDEAADAAAAVVRRGDLVLVKGSRGIKTDRVVDRLKAERS
jgi:UDP-N-acetylmuramoyl-tripeptide--D-alanyl-D-alanine ligase